MALTGITFDPLRIYGPERIVLACKVTIGTAGAVASVSGKGWGNGPNRGSVELDSGAYKVTLPGRGSVADIQVLGAVVEADAADAVGLVVAVDADDRVVEVTPHDFAGGAAVPASGTVLHLSFLVKNSPLD